MSSPATAVFINSDTGATTTIPTEVTDETRRVLTVTPAKKLGWTPGGWYVDDAGQEFMVKFYNSPFCYLEKLINNLARICAGEEFVPENIMVGHGIFHDKMSPCLTSQKVENYHDLIALKGPTHADSTTLKKTAAGNSFHRFYVFCALLGNDDLNEENLGLRRGVDDNITPVIVDYGVQPRWLLPEQVAYSSTPFYLASLISHRNLTGSQIVRRRYFGHDDFLDPKDRLKPQKAALKPEDISYLSILRGAEMMIKNQAAITAAIEASCKEIGTDHYIEERSQTDYLTILQSIKETLHYRINWMERNFGEDIAQLGNGRECERFEAVKWRLHPKFAALMRFEAGASKHMAEADLNRNLEGFCKLIGKERDEFLHLDLRDTDATALRKFANENFMLHLAIAAGDFELATWLARNDLIDPNALRNFRNHNLHLFRLTPLHTAIATYHDALYYEETEKQKPLLELITILREKFFEKNGEAFDPEAPISPLNLTFIANQKLNAILTEQTHAAATKIQTAFRAHLATKLSAEEQEKEGRLK